MATAASQEYVQKMFIAFLGRAASQSALDYYGDLIDADEQLGKDILFAGLYYGDNGQELYGGKSTIETIKIIFNNVMNRDPEDAGLIYWYNQITDGVVNVAEAAAIIADSAASTPADLAELDAKTTAATDVTAELTANPDLLPGYQTNFDLARDSLGDVTAANVGSFDAAAEVAAIANNYSSNSTLTTGDDTVAGTDGFVDVVTGSVGTGATLTAGDAISDPGTGDGDIVNLSGDGDVDLSTPATGISGFETINLDLAKQAAAGAFDVTNVGNDVLALNITTAATVEVVEIEVAGETEATVSGNLAGTITTTGVTDLTVTQNEASAFTVSGDTDLAALDITGANDDGVTVVLANNDSSVTIRGADGGNDAASVSAVGASAVDANDTVDALTLSGNGGAVNFTLSNVDAANAAYTIEGDQSVTLTGANDAFSGASLTDSSSGSVSIVMTSGNDVDLGDFGALSGGVELKNGVGDSNITLASGNTLTANDTQEDITLTSASNDGGEVVDLVVTDTIVDLVTADFDTVRINTGATAATINSIDADDTNDTAVSIAGTNDATVTTTVDVGSLNASISGAWSSGAISATGDTDASVSVTSTASTVVTGNITTGAAGVGVSDHSVYISAGNDATTGDIDTSGGNDSGDGSVTVMGVDVEVAGVDTSNDNVTLNATGALTLTTGDNDIAAGTGNVDLDGTTISVDDITGANVDLTASNDTAASDAGAITASGAVTIDGGNWTLDSAIAATGTLTITGGASTDVTGAAAVGAGSIMIDSTGDVDLGNDVDTSVINGLSATGDITATLTNGSGAAGVTVKTGSGNDTITTDENDTLFNITTGDGVDVLDITSAEALINTGDGADDVTVTQVLGAATVNTGDGIDTLTIAAASVAAGLNADTGAGADIVVINYTGNDVTVSTGEGDDDITLAADADSNVNAQGGNDTVTIGADVGGILNAGDGDGDILELAANDYSDDDLTISNFEIVDISAGAATISAETFAGDNTFALQSTGNSFSTETLTIAAGATDTTIDASGVTYVDFKAAAVVIEGGAGNDTLTHNAYSGTVNGGGGDDIIYGGDNADGANDVLNGNGGDDTIYGDAGVDVITGGTGVDSLTSGAGNDLLIFNDGDSGNDVATADTVEDYSEGTDTYQFGTDAGVVLVVDATNDNESTMASDANDAMDAGNDIYIAVNANDSGNTYVYIDMDNDGEWQAADDMMIILTGISDTADITAADFTNG